MSIRSPVTAAFVGVSNSNTIVVENGGVSMYVDGTFVGTVVLQGRPAGTAVNFQNLTTALTAPGISASAVLPGGWEYRMACTAFTSGTINCIMSASNQEGGG